MQGKFGFRLKPLSAALLMTLIAGQAQAAEQNQTSAAATTVLPSVTVSSTADSDDSTNFVAKKASGATKSDRPLIETSQSVSVVTQAQIAAQGAQNVSQALRYLGGVQSEAGGADTRFDTIIIRGFNADEYLDGLRLPTVTYWSRPNYDAYLLDKIEVIKGPNSVLYGQASPGGVVNLVSKRPTADPLHEIYVTTGNNNLTEGGLDLSGALDNDQHWLGRLTGTASKSDTQVDYTKYKHYDIAPALTWQPDDNTSLTFLSQFRKDPDAGFFNQLPVEGTLVNNPNGKISDNFYGGQPGFDSYSRSQESVGYEFMHHFDDVWTLHQNLRYMQTRSDYTMVYPFGVVANAPEVHRYSMHINEKLKDFDVDTHLQAKFDTGPVDHDMLFGVDYVHDDLTQNSGYGDASDLNYLNPDYSTPVQTPALTDHSRLYMSQTGFYTQDQMKWNKWLLNLGGRYDKAESHSNDLDNDTRKEQTDYATTGRAGLMYLFDSGIAPYVSYATSFQPQAGTTFSGDVFRPTKGKQSEVGIKYQPKSFDALFTAALYDLTQQNVLTADLDHPNFSVQTGEIRSRGLELEAKANITSRWLVSSSYAYTDPEVTASNTGNQGKDPVGIPRQTAAVWTEYALPGLLDGVTLGGGARYVGTSYATSQNSLKVPAVTVFDAVARYRWQSWQLALNVQNLTDKQYLNYCQDNGCHFGLRRQYLATLSYQW